MMLNTEKGTDKGREVQDQLITMSKQGQGGERSFYYNVLGLAWQCKLGDLHLGCMCI